MILLHPGHPPSQVPTPLAPRKYARLDGVRLGLLGNSKLNADAILGAIGELLGQQYALESVVARMKPSFSHPAPPEIVEEMAARCDVVLAGVGD